MSKRPKSGLEKSAEKLLVDLASRVGRRERSGSRDTNDISTLISADLVSRGLNGDLAVTAAGRAHLARNELAHMDGEIDPFLRQHVTLGRREVDTAAGSSEVTVNDAESPLVWLARRKGRDGRALIEPVQLQAGERLRADFTSAHMMPRVTSNWSAAGAHSRRGAGFSEIAFAEVVTAAQQRVRNTLEAVGPEFAGLLLDVCCFLKGLEDVERERAWPPRSAKVVLQIALDRLARHYGFSSEIRGRARAPIKAWRAPDANFAVGGE